MDFLLKIRKEMIHALFIVNGYRVKVSGCMLSLCQNKKNPRMIEEPKEDAETVDECE